MSILPFLDIGMQLIDKLIPDPEQKAKAQYDLMKLQQEGDFKELETSVQLAQNQAQTNQIEASNTNIFVAGWRPAIGWVCVVSLGFYYLPQFVLAAFMWLRLCILKEELLPYPVSVQDILALSMSMLGMVAIRTAEKIKGVAR